MSLKNSEHDEKLFTFTMLIFFLFVILFCCPASLLLILFVVFTHTEEKAQENFVRNKAFYTKNKTFMHSCIFSYLLLNELVIQSLWLSCSWFQTSVAPTNTGATGLVGWAWSCSDVTTSGRGQVADEKLWEILMFPVNAEGLEENSQRF